MQLLDFFKEPPKKTGNQADRLLVYLQDNKTIDPLVAWKKLGIYRLSARVDDLRRREITIATERVPTTNKWGEKAIYARYRLVA
jgi:hypothetical protein